MARFERHVFVCTNERVPGHPKGCCKEKGSPEVRDALKSEVKRRGLAGIVRINTAGCLDACEFGVSMVVYPEGIWYGGVRSSDVTEIIERTILNGQVIDRLLIKDPRYAPASRQYPILVLPPRKE
ncbi:MAG TPA: (2Fe-2S) ferredoxin domain-containing protein [Bacteroidota bacterium]|nr:(2Fe-2S) ferredoxin domain-containing protein [Bacteroidota bacterium]